KALESQLGGTDLFTDQALTVSVASRWRVEYDLISTGSNTQMYEGILTYEAPAGTWVSRPFGGTLTLDQTQAFSVRCRGTVTDGGGGVNNDDIVQTFQKIEYIRRQT